MSRLSRPLIILTLGLLTILVLLRFTQIDLSWEILGQLTPGYLLPAVLIHYSGFAVRGWRWRRLLGGLGYSVGFGYATLLLLAGWFVSALLPARLGDAARVAMLRRDHQISVSDGIASIISERTLDMGVILGLATLTALWVLPDRTPPWVWQSIAGGALGLLVVGAGLALSPRLEGWLRGRLTWPPLSRLIEFGFTFLAGIRRLARNPRLLLLTLGESVYIWLCDILLMYLVFLSLRADIALSVAAFISMIVDLAVAVPIIPGAIGQFEGAAVGVSRLFEIEPQTAALMAILNRLISFWSFMVVSGILTYLFGFAQVLQIQEPPQPDDV